MGLRLTLVRKGTTPDVYFKFETPLGLGDPLFDGKSDASAQSCW